MSDQALALSSQNEARRSCNAQHGGNRPDLVWDDSLAAAAQQWSNYQARQDQLLESNQVPVGGNDNVAFYAATNATPALMGGVLQWLGEVSKYNGEVIGQTGPGGSYEDWGHYTQIVWPTTTNVGVAIAQGASGRYYVTGYYSPGGNVQGQSAWGSNPTPPPPPSTGPTDCVFLVNSLKNGAWTSGLAWYPSPPADGQQPGHYVDLDKTGTVTWEGNSFSGAFPGSGLTFSCSINSDARAQGNGAAVGSAQQGGSGARQFVVYVEDSRMLYEVDGWAVSAVYRCA